MTDSPYISHVELALQKMEEERAERRAKLRAELGLGLTYDDLEILTDVPAATLKTWRTEGRLTPLPSDYRSPRFRLEDALAIIGDPDSYDEEGLDGTRPDVHSQTRSIPLGDSDPVHGPAHGKGQDLQKEASRRSGGRRSSSRHGSRGTAKRTPPGGPDPDEWSVAALVSDAVSET